MWKTQRIFVVLGFVKGIFWFRTNTILMPLVLPIVTKENSIQKQTYRYADVSRWKTPKLFGFRTARMFQEATYSPLFCIYLMNVIFMFWLSSWFQHVVYKVNIFRSKFRTDPSWNKYHFFVKKNRKSINWALYTTFKKNIGR